MKIIENRQKHYKNNEKHENHRHPKKFIHARLGPIENSESEKTAEIAKESMTLDCIVMHCIAMHSIALDCIALYCNTQHRIALHGIE